MNSMTEVLTECDELVKIYSIDELKVMALQGLDLKVMKGEMLAVIGKSGSGKSTLLNMLGGNMTPSAGNILYKGKSHNNLKKNELAQFRREKIGFVWQNSANNLLGYLTALENVQMPMSFMKKGDRKRALELLSMVGLEKYADRYPSELSGGEQQRVAIAVALANDPELILADEPTGAVDSKTSAEIFELFNKLKTELGLTIVIVTHDMALANKVDRVVMISDGKISTEKSIEKKYREYHMLDKAGRVKLSDELREKAGIQGNKVKINVVENKIIIEKADED